METFTYRYKQQKQRGFTLAELLVVIAIIGILTAISIPIFTSQLEKSREATDMANVRNAYAEVMMAVMTEDSANMTKTVSLKQKQKDWQSKDPVMIGGVSHYKKDPDTPNWKGIPVPDGKCIVSYRAETGILFNWKGNFFDDDVQRPLLDSKYTDEPNKGTSIANSDAVKKNTNYEFDSSCENSKYIPGIKEGIKDDNLLYYGTWAYRGNGTTGNEKNRYLLWSSVVTKPNPDSTKGEVGPNKNIPVIIANDGYFYISETTTELRNANSDNAYVTVSTRELNGTKYSKYVSSATGKYRHLEDAYDAYERLIKEKYSDPQKYPGYLESIQNINSVLKDKNYRY